MRHLSRSRTTRELFTLFLASWLILTPTWPLAAAGDAGSVVDRRQIANPAVLQAAMQKMTTSLPLDNVEDTWVNLNPVAVRPMTGVTGELVLYAVNTYLSAVIEFDATLQPVNSFLTPAGPVAIAHYTPMGGGPGNDQLLVVNQLSNVLSVHDRTTGDVVDLITLPPEPGDLVVDQAQHLAYVTSRALDQVVEIDLVTGQITQTIPVPSRNPTFLSMTPAGEVLVAPRWSGNNSAVDRFPGEATNPMANSGGMLDLAAVAAPGLPDEDLFWLDTANGQAVPVARSTGTILLAHGVNPATGELWQLNTEAINKNPAIQGEPALQGIFSDNRLTRLTLPNPLSSGPVQPPHQVTNLDQASTGPDDTVGTPYSLTFFQGGGAAGIPAGDALVTGLLTNNVVRLDSQAARVGEWDLPAGCIPRQTVLDATEQLALVYCSGLNTVPIYIVANMPGPAAATLDLGFDPTPEIIREGRQIFYNGGRSLDPADQPSPPLRSASGNLSCATCHDEGRLDLLAWDLSRGEIDRKGPMVTQTLASINRHIPFHWRGEQLNKLPDFNPAFEALLGGTPLSETPPMPGEPTHFDKFEAFVLSLEQPANPNQAPSREFDDTIQPPQLPLDGMGNPIPGNATDGPTAWNQACEFCHHNPTGSSNDMVADGALFHDPIAKRHHMKIVNMLSLWMKGVQPDVTVTFSGSGQQQLYPLLGFGTAHAGNPRNTFEFVNAFGLTDQEKADVTSMLFQFDHGIAPAAHSHLLLNANTVSTVDPVTGMTGQAYLQSYLIPQASAALRNADLAVFGRTTVGGTNRIVSWAFDRQMNTFRRDDNQVSSQSFFLNQVTSPGSTDWFVFVGLPVGTAPGFAIDYDRDQLVNQMEPNFGAWFDVDADNDTFWDGFEYLNGGNVNGATPLPNDLTPPAILGVQPTQPLLPQWTTSKVGRLTFETSELTTYSLVLNPPSTLPLPSLNYSGSDPKLQHNIIIDDMFPGVAYTGTLTVTDLGNLTAQQPVEANARFMPDSPLVAIVNGLAWANPPAGTGTVTFDVTAGSITNKLFAALPNHVIIARVLVNDAPVTPTNITPAIVNLTNFCVHGTQYPPPSPKGSVLTGPFVFLHPAVGLQFDVSGLSQGDVVEFDIEAVTELDLANPFCAGGTGLNFLNILNPPMIDDPLNPGTLIPNPNYNPSHDVPTGWSFPDTLAVNRAVSWTHP